MAAASFLAVGPHIYREHKESYDELISRELLWTREQFPEGAPMRPCVAIFIEGPRDTNIRFGEEVARKLRAINDSYASSSIVFHAAYHDHPWISEPSKVFAHLSIIARLCAIIGAPLVIHSVSRNLFRHDNGIATLERICADANGDCKICIETMPNDARYADPRMLNAIFDTYIANGMPRKVGLCIDTAHIWSAGADISSRENCIQWFDQIRADIPIVIHLNDCTTPLGSKRDIHANIGCGEIWADEVPRDEVPRDENQGYQYIIQWARQRGAPVILERHADEKYRAGLAQDIAKISHSL